jgi:hypothetical protein
MTRSPSERPFLGEAEAGQGYAIGQFRDLYFHDGRVGRGNLGGPQHRVLRENFAVHFGDEVILASCVVAPDLSEFDALNGHKISFSSDYSPGRQAVNRSRVTFGGGQVLQGSGFVTMIHYLGGDRCLAEICRVNRVGVDDRKVRAGQRVRH